MNKPTKGAEVVELKQKITPEQAKQALAEVAEKRAKECAAEIDAVLTKHDCYQYVIQIQKPGQSFYRILTEARMRA